MSRPKGSPNKTPRKGKTSTSGRPSLSIRFDPEELAAIRRAGGAPWARQVLLAAITSPWKQRRSSVEACAHCGASTGGNCVPGCPGAVRREEWIPAPPPAED